MQHAEGRVGRVFLIRLEDGERLPDVVEAFAAEHGVSHGMCLVVGGIGAGRIVVGPESPDARPVVPVTFDLPDVQEIAGMGTLAADEEGQPRLHMHAVFGRGGQAHAGCIRPGIEVWQLAEVVLLEILGADLLRRTDPLTGFSVLSSPPRNTPP